MSDLSDAQMDFLRRHLGFDTKGFLEKRRLKDQLKDFWGRRDKTEAELKILPPDHPQLGAYRQTVKSATQKAEGGDLKGAYADLKQVKLDARAAARIERTGLTPQVITNDVQLLRNLVATANNLETAMRTKVNTQADLLMQRARQLPDPAASPDRETAMQNALAAARERPAIIAEYQTLRNAVAPDMNIYRGTLSAAPGIGTIADRIGHRIGLLNKEKPGSVRRADEAEFMTLDAEIRRKELSKAGKPVITEIETLLRTREIELGDLLTAKCDYDAVIGRNEFTDNSGTPMTPEQTERTRTELADRFRMVEQREAERLQRAKEGYLKALEHDQQVMRITETRRPTKDSRVRSFDTTQITDEVDGGLLNVAGDDQTVANFCAGKLDTLLRDMLRGGSVPDEAFELCTRSPEDWIKSLCEAEGLDYSPEARHLIDPAAMKRIQTVAITLRDKAMAVYPNKSKKDLSEITLDGKTYGQVTQLGQGGGGIVYTAIDSNGKKVVFKRPTDSISPELLNGGDEDQERRFQNLRNEAMNHRSVTGGDEDDCHRNILDMKGMVIGPDGEPMIVMDLADAGDAEGYTESVDAAEATGLIPEAARQKMMGAAVRDMVRGMRAMQDKGMTHHDLKEANIFLMSDGTFKVADFGLSHHVEGRDGVIDPEFEELTPGYQPPELLGDGDLTQKGDNFTLGEILDKMVDPMMKKGRHQEDFSTRNAGPHRSEDEDGKVRNVSAFERLVNGLKDPDPKKRPTLDAVLLSSYMLDVDEDPEAVDRLKKATAEYAKTAGKKTAPLNNKLRLARGTIRKLEADLSDQLTLEKIDNFRRVAEGLDSTQEKFRKLLETLEDDLKSVADDIRVEVDPTAKSILEKRKELLLDRKKSYEKKIRLAISDRASIDKDREKLEANLGKQKTPGELAEINRKIEAQKLLVVDLTRQIEDIHADPQYADVVRELKEAGAAFS